MLPDLLKLPFDRTVVDCAADSYNRSTQQRCVLLIAGAHVLASELGHFGFEQLLFGVAQHPRAADFRIGETESLVQFLLDLLQDIGVQRQTPVIDQDCGEVSCLAAKARTLSNSIENDTFAI